jgi:DNA-binding transcriptional LysR family regulator
MTGCFGMDLRQLKYFLTIAEEGQITRAAKKLNMSQPPLSQQLQMLEYELDTVLMERNTRSIELTEAGKVLYERGKHLIKELEDFTLEVKEIGKGVRGSLSIGTVKTCLPLTSTNIVKFRARYPNVTYKIREGDTSHLAEQLKNRSIEAAVVRLPLEDPDLQIQPLSNEPYVLVVPDAWGIQEKAIPMQDIRNFPLLLLHRTVGKGVYEIILSECSRLGFTPDVVCECPDPSILMSLVGEGMGATLLPESTVSAFASGRIRSIALDNCSINSEAAIVWLRERTLSKTAARFIELFRPDEKSQ